MSKPLLSIQIPVTPDRMEVCQNLVQKLGFGFGLIHFMDEWEWCNSWVSEDENVELVVYHDDKVLTIGDKRERLYKKATATHSIQIDSDDDISDDAIELIVQAIKSNPDIDCITFEERIDFDGRIEKSNHSLQYDDWAGEGHVELSDGFHYHRTPYFKSVIKTEIARSVPIPHTRFGEDHQWARELKPHLKTEIHIPKELYLYIHRATPSHERYGFDKG